MFYWYRHLADAAWFQKLKKYAESNPEDCCIKPTALNNWRLLDEDDSAGELSSCLFSPTFLPLLPCESDCKCEINLFVISLAQTG